MRKFLRTLRRARHYVWLVIMWHLGLKGSPCGICTFYHLSHHNKAWEFDMENYPCEKFRPNRCDCCGACKS